MVLAVCLIAVRAASCLVPRAARAGWRRSWIARICHYATLLRGGGLKNRYVRARIWHHSAGAVRDAWHIRTGTPGIRRIRLATRKPEFSLATIALALAAVAVASRGLSITRAMLAPHYPDAGHLMLISETSVLVDERHPIPVPLLDFWKAHNTTFSGLAGYQWNSQGTAWVTPDFFDVLAARPSRFLLHPVKEWKPVAGQHYLGVLGRLKPGVTAAAAQRELRDLADRYRHNDRPAPSAQVMPLLPRIRQPLYSYAGGCALTAALLLAAACIGIRADLRRSGRIRSRYWAYFCVKSAALPLILALVIWEFSRATSFTLTGGATFVAEPIFIWLVILASGGIVWWCLADQWGRCRACLQTLQYPVRIGSLGAVLFDHAGVELVCCEGHGALYLPAVSSDYVQSGGWTALDSVVHG
jgi:hypothetical protein